MFHKDYAWGWDNMTREHMVSKMKKGWKGNETPCGHGSEVATSVAAKDALVSVVTDFDVHTVADVGAGDLNWILTMDLAAWGVYQYQGYDLVPRHESVRTFDATTEVLIAPYNLILCRHVLNHLSPKLALDALRNFKESGSTWLLMTNCDNQRAYWAKHGMAYGQQVHMTYDDCTKWDLELYCLEAMDIG